MGRANRARDLAIAGLGVLLFLGAAPPSGRWLLGVVAWAPLAFLAGSGQVGRSALLGWLQGTIVQWALLSGLPAALHRMDGTSLGTSYGLALLWAVCEGGRSAVVGLLASRAVRNGWPLVVGFPLALVGAECVYPMFFPWTTCLFFQGVPALLQGAEFGGPLLLSLGAGAIAASVASAIHARRVAIFLRDAVIVPAAILIATLLGGQSRMRAIDRRVASGAPLTVGIVQGDIEEYVGDPRDAAAVYRAASLDLVRRSNVGLLIWPEAAVPGPVGERQLGTTLRDRVFHPPQEAGAPLDTPVLTGLIVSRARAPGFAGAGDRLETWRERDPLFNSAVLAEPDGAVTGIYAKRRLVAFGEYLPAEGWFPWLRRWAPRVGDFSPGTSARPLAFRGERLGVHICLEDILGDEVLDDMAAEPSSLLVSLASDAWFGESRIPALHLALATLRAVEHRRFLVRVASTGPSGVVDPTGRIVTELPAHAAATTAATVRWMHDATLYERLGRRPWWGLAACAAALSVRPRRPRMTNRHTRAPGHSTEEVTHGIEHQRAQ